MQVSDLLDKAAHLAAIHKLHLGRVYNREKKAVGAQSGNANASKQTPQNEGIVLTAERLATEHGVSRATVERAGRRKRPQNGDVLGR